MMKRCFALLLTAAMVLTVMVIPVSAAATLDTDFNDASYTAIRNSADGDLFVLRDLTASTSAIADAQCTYDGSGNLVTGDEATQDTNIQHYEDAVYGRLAGDKSLAIRIDSESGTGADMQWGLQFQEGSAGSPISLNDGRAYEFSVAVTGGVSASLYGLNSYGAKELPLEEGRWNRVAVYLPTTEDTCDVRVFVNGAEATELAKTSSSALYRLRLYVNVPQGTTKAFVGIDDMRVLTGLTEYDGAAATAAPAVAVTEDYLLQGTTLKIPADAATTVDTLKAAITTTAEVRVFDDAMAAAVKGPAVSYSTQRTGTDAVQEGDVVVLEEDGRLAAYTVGIISEADKYLVNYDFEEEAETLAYHRDRGTAGKADGLYTREAADTSYTLTATTNRDGSAYAELPSFPSYSGSSFDASGTYTAEFSIAGMDEEYTKMDVLVVSRPTNAEGTSQTVSRTAVSVAQDGTVSITGKKSSFEAYSIPKQEWLRVAVTVDNAAQNYDLYLNGVLAAENIAVNTNATYTNWSGLAALRIATYEDDYTDSISTSVAVDDLKIYRGAYEGTEDAIAMTGYNVSGNTLFITDDTVTAAGMAAALGYDVAAYTDSTYATPETGSLGMGDVVVVTNGLIKRYFTVSDEVLPSIDKNFNDQTQTMSYATGRCETPTYAEAKFGRSAGDYSYAMTTTTASSAYYNLHTGTQFEVGSDWTSDSYIAGSGVMEFSLAFDGSAQRIELLNYAAYKNSAAETHSGSFDERVYSVPLRVADSGEVSVTDAKDSFAIYRINPGEWLRVAMVIDGENEVYDLYLNGELVAEDVSLAYSGDTEGTWEYIGVNGMRACIYPMSAAEPATLYLDDYKVYTAIPDTLTAEAIELGGYGNVDSVLLTADSPNADTIAAALSGYTVTAYEDSTYGETKAGALELGDVVVVSKGLTYRYLTVSDKALNLTFMVNGTRVNNLAAGAISASITPRGYATAPALIMAVYKEYEDEGRILVGAYIATEGENGVYTTGAMNLTAEELESTLVKLMVWDDLNSMTPLKEELAYSAPK